MESRLIESAVRNGKLAGMFAAAVMIPIATGPAAHAQGRSVAPPGPTHMAVSKGNGAPPKQGSPVSGMQHGPAPLGTVAHRSPNPANSQGNSNSVMGLPAPATGKAGEEPNNAPPVPTKLPAENYYGANNSGTFGNTENGPGPSSTEPESSATAPNERAGMAPGNSPVMNPNSVASVTPGGPAANGTGQPLLSNDTATSTIPVAPEDTGAYDNPQESPSAFAWIVVAITLLIGSVFGTIKLTQPGGQA